MDKEEAVVEGGDEVGTEVDIQTTKVLHSLTTSHAVL